VQRDCPKDISRYALTNGNVFNAAGISTTLANAGYAQPSDAAFLLPECKEFWRKHPGE
jgi:hypothetical protein